MGSIMAPSPREGQDRRGRLVAAHKGRADGTGKARKLWPGPGATVCLSGSGRATPPPTRRRNTMICSVRHRPLNTHHSVRLIDAHILALPSGTRGGETPRNNSNRKEPANLLCLQRSVTAPFPLSPYPWAWPGGRTDRGQRWGLCFAVFGVLPPCRPWMMSRRQLTDMHGSAWSPAEPQSRTAVTHFDISVTDDY